jgi:hypothetical protein
MGKFLTIHEICELYFEEIKNRNSDQQAERIINEFRSALFRFLLPEWGFQRAKPGRKMTQADTQAAEEYTKTICIQRLLKARELLKSAFDKSKVTQSSRRTYGNRIEQCLQWAEQQNWWPCERLLRIQNQCRPAQRTSGRRHYSDLPLTSRDGQYLAYCLKEAETSPTLQVDFERLEQYFVAPSFPERVFDPVKLSTGAGYIKALRLFLGFLRTHKKEPIPLDQLKLEDLVPVVTEDDLEGLSYREQRTFWKKKQLYVQTWLCEYFEFIKLHNNSTSPRTQLGKLCALQRLAHYLYRDQVSRKEDYDSIPIFVTLKEQISKAVALKKRWEKTKTYVAN